MNSKQWTLVSRPKGEPKDSDFKLEEVELPELKEGELLVKTKYLAVDPYMRVLMDEKPQVPMPGIPLGGVVVGEVAGEVVDSRSLKFKKGDTVLAPIGWRTLGVCNDTQFVTKVNPNKIRLQTMLGAAGMPGVTAYTGLYELGQPKNGETVVIAAAAGAVGSLVGQLAKLVGCRTVGIAGGPDKCKLVKDTIGFDAAIDYKSKDFDKQLKEACPNGIDVYFENVGGSISRSIAKLINKGARIPVCGFISQYNDPKPEDHPMHIFPSLDVKPTVTTFTCYQFMNKWAEAVEFLVKNIEAKKLVYFEDVTDGFENAPQALRDILNGNTKGKKIVKVA